MLITVLCDSCKHRRESKNNWQIFCDAFPDGMPKGGIPTNENYKKPCNNGIKYERRN